MKKQLLWTGILALIAALALVFGCAVQHPAVEEEETVVAFTIGQDMLSAKTIIPEQPMDITQYVLNWWKEGQDRSAPISGQTRTVDLDEDQTSATVLLLLVPGPYYFQVIGNNTNGFSVGMGYDNEDSDVPTTVVPKQYQEIPIVVRPIPGSGDLSITVEWPDVDFDGLVPEVSATITPVGESALPTASFTVDPAARNAVYTKTGLEHGYYRFQIQMVDPSLPPTDMNYYLWSSIDALRIIANDTSSTTYTLERELDALVAVEITEEMDNPLLIQFYVHDGTTGAYYYPDELPQVPLDPLDPDPNYVNFIVTQGPIMEFVAYPQTPTTPPIPTPVDSFEWFLWGIVPLAVAEEDLLYSYSRIYLDTTGLDPGVYWVNLLVTKGDILTSERIEFAIVP